MSVLDWHHDENVADRQNYIYFYFKTLAHMQQMIFMDAWSCILQHYNVRYYNLNVLSAIFVAPLSL